MYKKINLMLAVGSSLLTVGSAFGQTVDVTSNVTASPAPISDSAPFVESSFSGFGQITGGEVLSGSPTSGQVSNTPYPLTAKPGVGYTCPCFVANYEHAGLYQYKKLSFSPDSEIGVQGDFKFTPAFSATAQAVARAADDTVYLDWAYLTYKFTPQLAVQVGRKRLPLYYYSDFMYVSYDYPWLRTPQDLYAWQIYDYDGANVIYSTNLDRWAVTANAWAGSRTTKDNVELGNLYYSTKIEEQWKGMIGAYIDATNDIVDARLVYMHTDVDRYAVAPDGSKSLSMSGQNGAPVNGVGQAFYGFSLNADWNNWILRSELNYIDRPSVKNTYTAQMYSGGYQFDKHTFMLTWSQFRERAAYWASGVEMHTTESLTYRYDFAKSQALKVQYDKVHDESKWLFFGNANVLSASWQFMF